MKLRLYLDTSVFSLAEDDRSPERRELTRSFFSRVADGELLTSEVARREIMETTDPDRRRSMLARLASVAVEPLGSDAVDLGEQLVKLGIFAPSMRDDALHVAAAATLGANVLVSWNFRHLVNRRRRAMVNGVLIASGLPAIEIVSPPEV